MLREIFLFAFIALFVVLPIRLFIAQPFVVSGASMESTFSHGQYLIIDQITYRFQKPKRGDVVIFRYPLDPAKFFIKRIIGLPGDTVLIDGQHVIIKNNAHPQGVKLDEWYAQGVKSRGKTATVLRHNEYYVMGDNRDHSSDSRKWGILPRDGITGRVYLRLFPLNTVDLLPGSSDIGETINGTVI